ncbi:MAG: STAS domain-containing protein [Phycisphaeraceae bacterium]|nr:MAG: STAS domain-containing protein [Phycisphaeraceae bacterium]
MSTNWSDDIVISELSDEPALSEELSSLIDSARGREDAAVPHVVLNFASVTYVNSSNLAQLLKLRGALAESGRQVCLCGVSEDVWNVLKVSRLDQLFRIAPDPMTALASIQMDDSPRR